jgi:hypothetical protein
VKPKFISSSVAFDLSPSSLRLLPALADHALLAQPAELCGRQSQLTAEDLVVVLAEGRGDSRVRGAGLEGEVVLGENASDDGAKRSIGSLPPR